MAATGPKGEIVRVQILGPDKSGKTSIILRACHDIFSEELISRSAFEFYEKNLQVGDTLARVQLWDHVKYHYPRGVYSSMKSPAHIYAVTAPLDNRKDFEEISKLIEEITNFGNSSGQILLIGTKCKSVDRQVEDEELQALAEKYKAPYAKIDAKTGYGIEEMMNTLATMQIEPVQTNKVRHDQLKQKGGGFLDLFRRRKDSSSDVTREGAQKQKGRHSKKQKKT